MDKQMETALRVKLNDVMKNVEEMQQVLKAYHVSSAPTPEKKAYQHLEIIVDQSLLIAIALKFAIRCVDEKDVQTPK